MPRRRKHKKHYKNKQKKQENSNEKDIIVRTCLDTSNLSQNKVVTPIVTHNITPSPILDDNSRIIFNISPIVTTPLRRRSLSRRNSRLSSFNVTNLNNLFDCNNAKTDEFRKRSSSSIAKLHSPGKEKPLKITRGTQTNVEKTPSVSGDHIEIGETPKIKNARENSQIKIVNDIKVNVNPYLKVPTNEVFKKEGSFGEISFFSPQLFELKTSSTPILNDTIEKITSKSPKAILLNKTYVYKSPKLNRTYVNPKILSRYKSLSYSKLSVSRRSSIEYNESSKLGACEKVLNKIKKYGKMSARWSSRLIEICSHFGITVKNSLSTLCNIYQENSMLECEKEAPCKCREYQEEMVNLNSKITVLSSELACVKDKIEEQKNSEKENQENVKILQEELNKVKDQLSEYKSLKTELASLKDQIKCIKAGPFSAPPPPPPMPSLPPPPPPPPPPLPMATPAQPIRLQRQKKSENGVKPECDRPVISLDDILKVKLKKTSERTPHTPLSRRSTQPVISMDMLRQVKLRPSARVPVRSETPSTDSSTSPHSSLCRLLGTDSVWKVKRLRKIRGFSFDSVHRKDLNRRERENS